MIAKAFHQSTINLRCSHPRAAVHTVVVHPDVGAPGCTVKLTTRSCQQNTVGFGVSSNQQNTANITVAHPVAQAGRACQPLTTKPTFTHQLQILAAGWIQSFLYYLSYLYSSFRMPATRSAYYSSLWQDCHYASQIDHMHAVKLPSLLPSHKQVDAALRMPTHEKDDA